MTPDLRIARVGLVTAQQDLLAEFYCTALGFAQDGTEVLGGADFARAMDLPGARADVLHLRLGEQSVDLMRFAQPGQPYPTGSTSADLAFQHMAIVVSDMRAAYERLQAHAGWTPISIGGPQRLPATSGGVTAFKFRDPERHPLELLEFPPESTPAAWRPPHRPDPCLGIDHSAISVSSTTASAEFYAGLGFRIMGQSLNSGTTQQRLDGLHDAEVEVTALGEAGTVPHLELLCYRSAMSHRSVQPRLACNDIAATQLVLMPSEGSIRSGKRQSSAAVAWGQARMLTDPDGHHILVVGG